jgi:hypothetical protein
MNFKTWFENIVVQEKDFFIRKISSTDVPKYFIHRTESLDSAINIKKNGFNLKYFGKTGRKYDPSGNFVRFDPRGIYALPYDPEQANVDPRPFVIFSVNISRGLFLGGSVIKCKEYLFNYYNSKNSLDFSKKLLKDGYQALLSEESECIILDLNIINIRRSNAVSS